MAALDWYLQINLKARHLRLLITIDTYRNLTQAADVMHVTVPAVSKALAELERGLGLELFERTTKGLTPTPYGECLIRHARSMLTNLHQARDELKALSSGSEGKINIGVLPASSTVLLPQALAMLKRKSPGTNVMVVEAASAHLLPELWQGRLDLVVGRLPPSSPTSNFKERELLEERVQLVTGPQHPLARKGDRVEWADLRAWPWVLPPPGSILRDPLERALEVHEVPLAGNYVETLSTHLLRAYLQVSDAIAVLGDAAASDKVNPVHALPLPLPKMLRPAGVLWNANRRLTPGAELMIACLEEVAGKLRGALA